MSLGLIDLPWWGYIIVTFVLIQISFAGITLYLHRDQTHRGIDLHPAVRHFFRFWIWFTTGMLTKEWVAIHRKHHARCETEDDPHSPQILGIRKVLFEGAELYREESANMETMEKYGRGTPDDWLERNIYTKYSRLGVTLLAIVNILLFGPIGITIWAVQMAATPFCAAGIINGLGHYVGYRNFECKDAATNVSPWGLIMAGEELHNNHHAFPSSAKFSVRAWEFDTGWLYIRMLKFFGLVKIRRVAPKPVFTDTRRHMDLEAVKAVVINRLHVLRDYSRHVTLPVLQAEMQQAGSRFITSARKLLTRDNNLLDEGAQTRLREILDQNHTIHTVYEYRQRLQKLWESSTASNERLVQQFMEWCAHAEASGIEALREFAKRLRSYSLQPA
ncbi:MAG: fatty acid desaturase [Gammaproteobacteria bacterium]|nr:fatty acid desaturase [Gammaproteobacteria bacterium]